MSFASPDKLIWLWVALPIIGFYILRTRLRRRKVATLLFWDQVFEEKRQRSLWQNLRHWISLLLQLILVGMLATALADPLWNAQSQSGQELILIVDNSASMRAVDPDTGSSRLEQAVAAADDIAAGLRQGDSISLITAGSSVRVVVGMTDFAPAISEALQSVRPTDGPTRVVEAIEAGRRLSNQPERRRIVVFSDARLQQRQPDSDATAQTSQDEIPTGEDLRWVQVGASIDNVGITTFQVRRSTVDPIGYALLVELANFSDEPTSGRLKLELGQDLVDVMPYSLEPNQRWRKVIEGTSREGGVLAGSIDSDDGLLVDNLARAIIPRRPMIPVTLVSDEDAEPFYLRTVLQSIPLIELTETKVGATNREEFVVPTSGGQLTVFSGVSPTELPEGPALIVSPNGDGPLIETAGTERPSWTVGPSIESPIIATQDEESALLRHVRLQNVILDGGQDIDVDPALGDVNTLLETAGQQRVLVSVDRSQGRLLILGADLGASDLPLRIAFPVMMSNAINWFFRQSGDMNPALATGRVTPIDWDIADESDREATLIDPSGKRILVTIDGDRVLIGPIADVGVYGLFSPSSIETDLDTADPESQEPTTPQEWIETPGANGRLLAVNLCDPIESDLRLPELDPQLAGDAPPGGAPAWFYLVLLAIGLVIGEWALFNRRIVA